MPDGDSRAGLLIIQKSQNLWEANQRPLNRRIIPYRAPYGINLKDAKKRNQSLEETLIDQKVINESKLYKTAAEYYKLPFIDLKDETIRKDILFLIPESIATSHQMIAFDKTDAELKVATLNPDDLQIFEFLAKKTGLEVKVYLTTPESLDEILKTYPSKSHPGREYHVIKPKNGGDPYCDCWQWKKTRNCTHLRQYHGVGIKQKKKPADFNEEIDEAVRDIINK